MTVKLFGGINECLDGTFSITPHMPLGRLSADKLKAIADIVERFGLPGVQANTAQRIVIEGIPADSVNEVVKMLKEIGNDCPQSIIACKGYGKCKRGLQDTQGLAMRIEQMFIGFSHMPAHLKVGLSGCPRCCGASYVKGIGLVGNNHGWTLVFGGNAGRMVRCGDEIMVDTPQEHVLEVLKEILFFYIDNAKKGERTARFVERLGFDFISSTFLKPRKAKQ